MSKNMVLLAAMLAISRAQASSYSDLPWDQLYNAYPQPATVKGNVNAIFSCIGQYALCSFAACNIVPGSNPLVAECGCYSFTGMNLGFGPFTLSAAAKNSTLAACDIHGNQCPPEPNSVPFCEMMNNKTMYNDIPGVETHFDYVSTFNPSNWPTQPSMVTPKTCTTGGTFADCFSAACIKGAPTTSYLPPLSPGQPQYNATCFCPVYTTTESFALPDPSMPCGTTNASDVTESTVIYNGA